MKVEREVNTEAVMHPGELWNEAIASAGVTQAQVCRDLGIVSPKHLNQIVRQKALPSVELVIALADYLGVPVRTMWNVQSRYVLDKALGERAASE